MHSGRFEFSLHRKPHFVPQYVSYLSSHAIPYKRGIFKSLVHRYLVLSSTPSAYYREMRIAREHLLRRSHPSNLLSIPAYNRDKREHILACLYRANYTESGSTFVKPVQTDSERIVRLIIPFSHINVRCLVFSCLRRLSTFLIQNGIDPPRFSLGWSNQPNLFRLDYKLNTPCWLTPVEVGG
jgi:hypothetical protein